MTNATAQAVNIDEKSSEEIIANFYESLDNDHADDAEKIKAFIKWGKENRNLDESLAIATIEQFGVGQFVSYAEDVTNHGIMGGFSGFTWYTDTEEFYTTNKDSIIQWAKDLNDSFGDNESYLVMIASFEIMKKSDFGVDDVAEFIYSGDEKLEGYTVFANNMAWGAAEDVCRHYVDFLEESDFEEEEDEDE